MSTTSPGLRVVPAAGRYVLREQGRTGWHCFSYGPYYDQDNTHLGLLLACSEHLLAPGAGFDRHRHHGVDIVSWVLAGELEHTDAQGRLGRVAAGAGQLLRTGAGTWHAERNAGADALRFVQLWIRSSNAAPSWTPIRPGPVSAGPVSAGPVSAGPVSAGPVSARQVRLAALGEIAVDLIVAQAPVTIEGGTVFGYLLDGAVVIAGGAGGAPRLGPGDQLRATGTGPLVVAPAAPAGGVMLVVSMPVSTGPAPRDPRSPTRPR